MKIRDLHRDNRIKGMAGLGLIAIGILLTAAARYVPGFAHWYSTHVYPVWVNVTGRIMGWFPFSVSEVLLYLLILGVVLVMCRSAWRKKAGMCLFLLAAVLYFLYVVNCGVNYHRESFSESSGIRMEPYTVEELKEVCIQLTEEVNDWSTQVDRDARGVMDLNENAAAFDEAAVRAMEQLGEAYPELAGYYPRPKGLLVPWILSVQQLSGIYSPFTVEANYNSGMVDYNLPFTACHELSHLRGFMQEQEANFIAFLACREAEEAEFQYSGAVLGWIYCMNVLYQEDYEAWEEVRGKLSPAVEPDLQENREFWAAYDGAAAEVSNKINDTYLKANGQAEGVKSYDRMVDLIVALYKQ